MGNAAPKRLTRVMDGLLARFDYDRLLTLVIEPDPTSRASLVRALEAVGLPRPAEAGTAAEALAIAADLDPALVVCDAALQGPEGGVDGLELLQRIRADSTTLPPDVPVIVLSGETRPFSVMEAKRLGVDAFLIKPVPAKRLHARLQSVMMKRFPDRVSWGP